MSEQNITELLHPAFLARMKEMLGEEYDSFIKSYKVPRTYGLRVNTAKISCEEFEKLVPFPVTPIPWIPNGYFYPEDVRPSYCPFYQAGLYYLQEPSAMTPASCHSRRECTGSLRCTGRQNDRTGGASERRGTAGRK